MDATDNNDSVFSPEEQIARQFYRWELRGRGWVLWDRPVDLEPPFRPFTGYYSSHSKLNDDGRQHTAASRFVEWLQKKWAGAVEVNDRGSNEPDDSVEPDLWKHGGDLTELQLILPRDAKDSVDLTEQLLLGFSACRRPPAFELIGTADRVVAQFVCDERDVRHVRQHIEAHIPKIAIAPQNSYLAHHWNQPTSTYAIVAELGLSREFMLPIATGTRHAPDPLTGIVAVLADVEKDETALVQIMFQPVQHPWAESILRSLVFADGTPLFSDTRDYLKLARVKVARPLYAAVMRFAASSPDEDRTWELGRRLASAMEVFNSPQSNGLIPLDNDDYDPGEHAEDLLLRRSRRGGMLLSSPDVASAVLSNAHVRVCFRVSDDETRKLADGFADFESRDLQSLGIGEAICRVERADFDFNLKTSQVPAVESIAAERLRRAVVSSSRDQYAAPREVVEAQLAADAESRAPEKLVVAPTPVEKGKDTKAPPHPPTIVSKSKPSPPSEPTGNPAEKTTTKDLSLGPKEPRDLGRGGQEHKYIQQLIKQHAEGFGYRASIEYQVQGSRAADVALTKGQTSIACEICISTDDEHELGNVRKCLASGFQQVLAISPDPKRLRKLKASMEGQLTPDELTYVQFLSPDEARAFISDLEVRNLNQEKTVRGYKVKTTFTGLDPEEAQSRRESISRVVAKAVRRVHSKGKKPK